LRVTIASRIVVIKDNRPVELTVSEILRENTEQLVAILKRELELREKTTARRTALPHAGTHLHRGAHLQADREVQDERSRDRRGLRGFKPFKKQLIREIADADVEKCCRSASAAFRCSTSTSTARRWRRRRRNWTRRARNLKNLTKYVIGHLEALLEKYGPQYPRLTTKSARHEEVDVKAVAFKAFKVSLRPRDRLRRLQGFRRGVQAGMHEVRQDAARVQGRHLQGHRTAGEIVRRAGIVLLRPAGARPRVHLRLHRPRRELSQAVHVRRHDFEQGLFCIPEKSRILFFAPDTPKLLYIRYKPAPHQKISQQTCDPNRWR
jgi:hypothetical protein